MNETNYVREFLASLSVFLVALPLCMGIAIASDVPPVMGILSGIIGGIVVGTFAGAPLQVSGPAAGLTVIVFDLVKDFGLEVFGVIVLLAGMFQIAAGYFRLGRMFRAVAPAVIYAMLAGIGILIFASQTHVMVDLAPASSGLTNIATIPKAIMAAVSPGDGGVHQYAAGIGLLTLAILIGWNTVKTKLPPFFAAIPASLLAVAGATAVSAIAALPIAYVDAPDNIAGLVRLPTLSTFAVLAQPAIWLSAFGLAVVASAESLLCAAAVDKMHDGEAADLDREVTAQGIGNAVLGILGGLPLTGVIVRSTVNIEAGATTRISAILHGFWLCLTISLVPWTLELIPLASLAAVLVHIGYKLVNVDAMRELRARGRGELAIYAVTVASIVSLSLLKGLVLGIILSVFHMAYKSSRFDFDTSQSTMSKTIVNLRGVASFMSYNALLEKLNAIEGESVVELHIETSMYLDHACATAINEWKQRRTSRDLKTTILYPKKKTDSGGAWTGNESGELPETA